MTTRQLAAAALAAAIFFAPGCSDSTGPGSDYDPDLPAEWAAAVTNPWFPLAPGTQLRYEGETEDGTETIEIEVLERTRVVNGVTATVVRDRAFLDGDLIEETEDWFAQDSGGNVWYLGEDTKEIENGQVVSTAGSWEWGVDGALPGIVMWADPAARVGEAYRQEYYAGEAEDMGKVLAVDQSVTVPLGSFTGCIQTEDTTPLEPDVLEHKYYCNGVGTVLEVAVESGERVELVERDTPASP